MSLGERKAQTPASVLWLAPWHVCPSPTHTHKMHVFAPKKEWMLSVSKCCSLKWCHTLHEKTDFCVNSCINDILDRFFFLLNFWNFYLDTVVHTCNLSIHPEDCRFKWGQPEGPCLTTKPIKSNFELPSNAKKCLGWPSWGLTASWLFESVTEMSPLYYIIHLTVFNLIYVLVF